VIRDHSADHPTRPLADSQNTSHARMDGTAVEFLVWLDGGAAPAPPLPCVPAGGARASSDRQPSLRTRNAGQSSNSSLA